MGTIVLISFVSIGLDGATGRVLFVSGLILSAFVAYRYFQSLKQVPRFLRTALVLLSFVIMLILAAAAGGLSLTILRKEALQIAVFPANNPTLNESGKAQLRVSAQSLVSELEKFGIGARIGQPDETTGSSRDHSAAVLVTDAAMSDDDAQRTFAGLLPKNGSAPIYVLQDPDPAVPRVELRDIDVSRIALIGVPVTLSCVIHSVGMQGKQSIVTIANSAVVEDSVKIDWDSAESFNQVTLRVVPKTLGVVNYGVSVESVDGLSNPDLQRSVSIVVEDTHPRVLYIEGQPTWEGKFIRRALEESGIFDVDYFSQVSKNAFIEQKTEKADSTDTRPALSETPLPDSIARLHAILRNLPQLCTYKAIVFGSTPASMISPSEAANIGNWLSRRGGGLIFTGGNSFAGSVATTGSSLSALMPATVVASGRTVESVGRESPVEAAKVANQFTLEINANGLSTPLGEFERKNTDGKLNIALSGDGFVFGNLKAGTIVIADLVSEKARGSRRYGIVAMPLGEGRVITIGPSDSWKIKTAEPTGDPDSGAGPFATLWHGIVLYAVQNAGEQSELALSESTPSAGSRLRIRLRSRGEDFSPSEINGVSAFAQELEADSQNSALPVQLSFLPVPDSTSVWQTEVTFKSPGTYAVTANFDHGGRSESITRTVTVSDPRRFPSGSASEAFSRLAHERGGRLYHRDEISSLVESLLKLPHSIKAHYETWQLRRLWPMAFILPLLASLGWFLQRRYAELV